MNRKIQLRPGYFQSAQEMGKEYLHYLQADRLLAPLYEAIGLEPKAKRYGGWESMEIAGHSLGHFLSASAQMVETTGDVKLREKILYILEEMAYLQKMEGTGYISGFKRDCFDRVFSGTFEVERFGLGGSWVPWYSIHKIYQGLIDVYKLLDITLALDLVIGMADWAVEGTDRLDDQAFERMLTCEFGGMNEAMAHLYEITGKLEYLRLAKRFCHKEILEPLKEHEDHLEGYHANTQIPKVLGLAKLYTVEGDEADYEGAKYFFDQVTQHRSYVIGGNSYSEHFVKADQEPLGVTTTESCNTYNMMRLAAYLYGVTGEAYYMAYYEKALLNHIMTTQDPDSGMKAYFIPTEPGHFKTYCSPDDSFWCCTGSGMENPAKYQQEVYHYFSDQMIADSVHMKGIVGERCRVTVDLFISSEYQNDEAGVCLIQETAFPYEKHVAIEVKKWPQGSLTLALRVPPYLKDMPEILVDGSVVEEPVFADGYILLRDEIQEGCRVEMVMDYGLGLYRAMDDASKIVFLYGPIVLAGALGRENFPDSDIQPNHLEFVHHPKVPVPVLVDDLFEVEDLEAHLSELIEMVDSRRLHFKTKAMGQPGSVSIELIPFMDLHHQRYSLYFQTMTPDQYAKESAKSPSYQEWLSSVTVDEMSCFEQQSEIEHRADMTAAIGDYATEAESGWREAGRGAQMSFTMSVRPETDQYLCATYWGSDGDLWAPDGIFRREFDILVSGQLLTREYLKAEKGSRLYDVFYKLPQELIGDQSQITITFKSQADTLAGRLFFARITSEAQ